MKRFTAFISAALLACVACNNRAWAHGAGTIAVNVSSSAGKMTISGGQNYNGTQVFADRSERFNVLGTTEVPGWSFTSIFNGATIHLDVLSPLYYWTPGAGMAATTTDSLFLNRTVAPIDSAEVKQTSIVDGSTILWDMNTVGGSHHILSAEISAGQPVGAYGLMLRLRDPNLDFEASDPFLLVLNNGLTGTTGTTAGQPFDAADTSQFGDAVAAIAATAVPEPSSVVLLGMGAVAGGMAIYRRRKQAA